MNPLRNVANSENIHENHSKLPNRLVFMLISLPGIFSPGLRFAFEKIKCMQNTQFFLAVSFGQFVSEILKKPNRILMLFWL